MWLRYLHDPKSHPFVHEVRSASMRSIWLALHQMTSNTGLSDSIQSSNLAFQIMSPLQTIPH
jgi:hypothetical protein